MAYRLLLVLALTCIIQQTFAFNFDINHAIIYNENSVNKSYFGFSTFLIPGADLQSSRIQIGAPKYGVSGAVYICNIFGPCSQISVNKENANIANMTNAFIGGTMDVDYINKISVICGQLWKKRQNNANILGDWPIGQCFWSYLNENKHYALKTPFPESTVDKVKNKSVLSYGIAQLGFSAHFTKAEKLLLGAPGVLDWQGSTALFYDSKLEIPISKRQTSNENKFQSHNYINFIIDNTFTLNFLDYFGYSVTSGFFFNKAGISYAAGAPKHFYRGKVIVFDYESNGNPVAKASLKGERYGEYFGASLAAGDINGDGLDDLVVGAPFYSESDSFNNGRIYIFYGNSTGRFETPIETPYITGNSKKVNNQFGLSITFIGDIDSDGFLDLAVGAPYENDGSGVVYIFKGSKNGLIRKPAQIIEGNYIDSNIKGFGISISKPVDIDNNFYRDIAIGAHISKNVILLRSNPIVIIEHSISSNVKILDLNSQNLTLTVCISWKEHTNSINSIEVSRIIQIEDDNRVNEQVKRMKLNKQNRKMCEEIQVFINHQNYSTNYIIPKKILLSHEYHPRIQNKKNIVAGIDSMQSDLFCPKCGVYDEDRSSKLQKLEIPYSLGCGDDNVCDANIIFDVELLGSEDTNSYVLGSKDTVQLKVSLENIGENAIMTGIHITLPSLISLKNIPSVCTEMKASVFLCSIANPLLEKEKKSITFDLDMIDINKKFDEDVINFLVEILTSSSNKGEKSKIFKVNLRTDAEVTIQGKSEFDSGYYYNKETAEALNFTQKFQVNKTGPTSVKSAQIELHIASFFKSNNKKFIDDLNMVPVSGNAIIDCHKENILESKIYQESVDDTHSESGLFLSCANKDITCITLHCNVGPLTNKDNNVVFNLKYSLNISALEGHLIKDSIIFETKAIAYYENKSNSASVRTTLFDQQSKEIAAWIIAVSVIGGLLLLVLLIAGLYKLGFFKRHLKNEIEAERGIIKSEGED